MRAGASLQSESLARAKTEGRIPSSRQRMHSPTGFARANAVQLARAEC